MNLSSMEIEMGMSVEVVLASLEDRHAAGRGFAAPTSG